MGEWGKNPLSPILEYPFDFERYIEERLREIEDPEERQFAKTIFLDGLGNIIKYTERKYEKLERQVYDEAAPEANQYEVAMTVTGKEEYDPGGGIFYPVYPDDLEIRKLQGKALSPNGIYLETVYLETDRDGVRRCLEAGTFYGTFTRNGMGKAVVFHIRPAVRYRETIELLYRNFLDNHIPWRTVNIGYLEKFCDIYIDKTQEGNADELTAGTPVPEECSIWFGRFSDIVRPGRIPVWNIQRIPFCSHNFTAPCEDGLLYEHEFTLSDKDQADGYLIQRNPDILEIRHEERRIVVRTHKDTFEGWQALRIVQKDYKRQEDFQPPILTNHIRDSFIRRFAEKNQVRLMTKADLFRRIMELDIRKYIKVVGYEICDNAEEFPLEEGMNWFVNDELFPMEIRKVLVFQFKPINPSCFLNDTMVWYAISQIQLEIGEYRCVGIIV